MAGQITDIIRKIFVCDKALDVDRIKEKEPHLAAGRAVDAFFHKGRDMLDAAKKTLTARLTAYQTKMAAEEKARRDAEAKALAEEAARVSAAALELEQAGASVEANQQLQQAVVAEDEAYKAKLASEAKMATMTRSYGDSGARAALRTVWVGEFSTRADVDLNVLRMYFTEDAIQKAINNFIRTGGRTCGGVKIYQKSESVVR